jgi:hypothetical protein
MDNSTFSVVEAEIDLSGLLALIFFASPKRRNLVFMVKQEGH